MDLKIHVIDFVGTFLFIAKRLVKKAAKFLREKVIRPLAQVVSKSARTLAPPVVKKAVKKSTKKRG